MPIQSDKFTLSIYFGRNMASCYDRLQLFNLFQASCLAGGVCPRRALGTAAIAGHRRQRRSRATGRSWFRSLPSIFFRPPPGCRGERARDTIWPFSPIRPSPSPGVERKALQRFIRAGESLSLAVERIGHDDYARVAEFDALFIRETTAVNHYTYRFSQRAAGEGLVVIDDPDSIVNAPTRSTSPNC